MDKYVFYSANEMASNAPNGFWNATLKTWDSLKHATTYKFSVALNSDLPLATGDDARIVSFAEANSQYGDHAEHYYLLNPPH